MSTGYKFLRFIKTKRLLIFDWIDRVILGNRKLTISAVPVFIEGKDPCDESVFEGVKKDGVGHGGPEQEFIVVEFKRGDDRKFRRAPKADDDDQHDGQHKENE